MGVAGDLIFVFFDSDLPIHYITFMGLRWRLTVHRLQVSIAIVKVFFNWFLVQNLAGSRDLWIGGRRWPHIWFPWPRLAYSLSTFIRLRWRLRVVYRWASPLLRLFWRTVFQVPSKIGEKFAFFWGKMWAKCKILFLGTPKRHILARNDVNGRINRANRCRGLGCRRREEPKKTSRFTWCAFSHIWGAKGVIVSWWNFCTGVGVSDVITHANLGDDQFRGFWGSGGRISHFSIDLRCRP